MNPDILEVKHFLMDTEDEDANIYETSFVETPATGFDFLKFNNDEIKEYIKTLEFKKVEVKNETGEYKRMVSGVWFMPDTKYVRYSKETGIYTVEFKQEALKNALIKYLKSDYANLVKVEHQGSYLEGFVSMEHWIYNGEGTKSPIFGLTIEDLGYTPEQVKVGTVFKTVYVQDEQFWNEEILTGNVKGFSIGGLFSLEEEKQVGIQQFNEAQAEVPTQEVPTQGQSVPEELPSKECNEGDDAEEVTPEQSNTQELPQQTPCTNTTPDISQILSKLAELESKIENYNSENSLLKQQLNQAKEENALLTNEKQKIEQESSKVINNLSENLKASPIKPIQKSNSKPEVVSNADYKIVGGVKIPLK